MSRAKLRSYTKDSYNSINISEITNYLAKKPWLENTKIYFL